MDDLWSRLAACISARDPQHKLDLVHGLAVDRKRGKLPVVHGSVTNVDLEPGRPGRPRLVRASAVARRGLGTERGRAAFLHAICHIEFNAINLALDACHRFRTLPARYYDDWILVAREEAGHFDLLRTRLRQIDYDYGDFPAHDGLWEVARSTATDPLARMALVPRLLEARGLDVSPGMISRLDQVGDSVSARILEKILTDEIGHVAIGSNWFRFLCGERGLEPEQTFLDLVRQHLQGPLRGPINEKARLAAGFTPHELAALQSRI